ncbi:hypothetical protein FWG76_01080 [Candidatus Saccharibacteria bacterium]|nr:hypothetical protein [Candidatus Saccharibacteria bacterium]
MNDAAAIRNGSLANNSRFFGDNTSETTSTALNGTNGSWNIDRANFFTTSSWMNTGGSSGNGADSGIFAHDVNTGGQIANHIGHRTILLGY